MTFSDYQAAEGVSKSMLDDIADPSTPAHFKAKHIDRVVTREETPALRFGRLFHTMVLEPFALEWQYAFKPADFDGRTTKSKEWLAENSARTIIADEEGNRANAMTQAVWNHPIASKLLKGAQVEQSLFATDSHGTKRKGRLDIIPRGCNALADLKSVESAAPDKFERQLLDFRWFVQAAYYLDLAKLNGIERESFAFILVEKKPPYLCAVYTVAPEVIELGRKIYQRDLALYRHCMERNEWPGYPSRTVGLPRFAMQQFEQFI